VVARERTRPANLPIRRWIKIDFVALPDDLLAVYQLTIELLPEGSLPALGMPLTFQLATGNVHCVEGTFMMWLIVPL
jgi:hypothetical protein